jgi:hypothetical protein
MHRLIKRKSEREQFTGISFLIQNILKFLILNLYLAKKHLIKMSMTTDDFSLKIKQKLKTIKIFLQTETKKVILYFIYFGQKFCIIIIISINVSKKF